ncbi:MAG: flagellar motor protein MotB [Rhodospirillaceae bacterium]
MAANETAPIIVKKIVKGGHAHHGGAWKVAYADFVTAMMAFFLLLWLLNATTQDQKQGISEYFSPSTVSKTTGGAGGLLGGAAVSSPGAMTSRTAVPSVSLELRPTSGAQDGDAVDEGGGSVEEEDPDKTSNISDEKLEEELAKREQESFEKAEAEIRQAIEDTPELRDLQKHIVIDQTPEGLRIQLVDQENKPMFALGSARMEEQTKQILGKIAQVVQKLPNRISISGHTDAKQFRGSRAGFGNWELSAHRALESRRAMVENGLDMARISHVTGKAETDPLVREDPDDPRNRRISIVLLREASETAKAIKDARAGKAPAPAAGSGGPSLFRRDWSGPRLK